MINRLAASDIGTLLKEFPVVVILGPRQVGKTTLAQKLLSSTGKEFVYFDLERTDDLQQLQEAEFIFSAFKTNCVVIDEVQRMPSLFSRLRPEIDSYRKPGRFLLTGSASPDLVKGVSESLAGRAAFVELYPIMLAEALKKKISMGRHWFRGGFPSSLLASSDGAAMRWMNNFIRTYIERDLRFLFGTSISESIMQKFWYMLADNQGGIWNAESYARSLGVTGPTINRYLDFLSSAFLVRKLSPWFFNARKRLVKSPKIYIRDSGLLHALNRISDSKLLPANLAVGASWEGYVIEQIAAHKSPEIDLHYYRTHHGAECDLVLVRGLKPVAAIEIKFSNAPVLSKGFFEAMDDIKLDKGYCIVPKSRAVTAEKSRVETVDLRTFISNVLPKL